MTKCFPILAVLLAASTLMAQNDQTLARDDQARDDQARDDQALPACEGIGIYRSFTLARQFKLAAAYFVNPSLPDRARILNAYSLEEAVKRGIESEKLELALPVNDDGAWMIPAPLAPYISHCRSSSAPDVSVSGDAPVAFTRGFASVKVDDQGGVTVSWSNDGQGGVTVRPNDLSPEHIKTIYVLSEDELDLGADHRVITWDPDESVSVVR